MTHDLYSRGAVEELCLKYRNWSRWGRDDQLGTLNFITPEKVARACSLAQIGRVVSCALPYDGDGPQTGALNHTNPIHVMLQSGRDIAIGTQDHMKVLRYTDDAIFMSLQGGTRWDALARLFHDGRMYNGWDTSNITSSGAERNGIEVAVENIVGRGILIDVARHRGVSWLEPGEGISGQELAACCAAQGIVPDSGDIVLVRTGQMASVRDSGSWGSYAGGSAPGLDISAADWLINNEIAAFAADTWDAEVRPNQSPEVFQPLHLILLVNAGMMIGKIFDLESLARTCEELNRWEFLLIAPPLPFTGAVGSPLNPSRFSRNEGL